MINQSSLRFDRCPLPDNRSCSPTSLVFDKNYSLWINNIKSKVIRFQNSICIVGWVINISLCLYIVSAFDWEFNNVVSYQKRGIERKINNYRIR